MPAAMPGTVHYHLQRLSKIPDPFYGRNELDLQWVDEQDWELAREVQVTPLEAAQSRQELVFDGIDTVAEIFLNGKKAGQSVNMFRQVVVDVRGKLKAGSNEIRVLLKSPTRYAWAQAARHHYRANADKDFKWETGEARESRRAWIRKVQCQFGWDWGVYLATSGLWRSTRLECSDAPRIASLQTRQVHQGPPGKPHRVVLELAARLQAAVPQEGMLMVQCGGQLTSVRARLKRGENLLKAELILENPKLWWPSGQGDQPLYGLEVVWEGTKGERNRLTKRLGLRTLELVTAKDAGGESFLFKVNGRPVFMKGANWIPADAFIDRCTPERYRHWLTSMVGAHMNMVRVWGGGQYELDVFYDLCDELGIMVWQDFMMACALYPDTPEFIEELTEEARYQIRRLSDHPSIALWCGDNEDLGGVKHWWIPGGQATEAEARRYPAMYRKVLSALRATCEAEDPSRRFWLSSPSNGSFEGDPDDPTRGDVHYWKVWHGGKPFSDYLTVRPRFVSEFGFQSFPDLDTLKRVVPPGEMNPSSWVMEHHQRSPLGNLLITNTLARELPIPKDFESFCLASQVNQAMAIRTAVEHWRRLRPHCMGTLFWQVNDLWPVASWSSMDYHGRWKALHHEAQRFFAPLLVSLEKQGRTVSVWATNDLPRPLALKGWLESVTWAGKRVYRAPLKAALKPGESRRLLTLPFEWILKKGMHSREVLCFARLEDGEAGGENYAALVPWKWAPLERPQVKADLRQGREGLELHVQSRNIVPFFHARLDGWEGRFDGDWKVLKPGEKYVFRWTPHFQQGAGKTALAEAKRRLRITTFYDLCR
jgi:beta-mannosidase